MTLFGVPLHGTVFASDGEDLVLFGVVKSTTAAGKELLRFNLVYNDENTDTKLIIHGLRLIDGIVKPPAARIGFNKNARTIDHVYFGKAFRRRLYNLLLDEQPQHKMPLEDFDKCTKPLAITENRIKGLDNLGGEKSKTAPKGLDI